MATKRKFVGRRSKTAKFKKQNKTKVRKSVKFTKSKRHNKKRKHKTKRSHQKGGDDDECAICHIDFNKDENGNIIDDIITLICGHKFHRDELIQWCQTKGPGRCTCPNDRINISAEMAQYMPALNNPPVVNNIVNQIANPIPNPNYISSDSDEELSENTDIDRLEIFQGDTNLLLNSMPYVPLPEAPYLEGADLPAYREGGPKDRIKNLLICLFSNEDYFIDNFNFFINCRDLNMEIVDDDDEEGVERLKVTLISKMMSLVNDILTYRDDHLRGIISNFLKRCAANALGIIIIDQVSRVASR
jgi:hypothetical protein